MAHEREDGDHTGYDGDEGALPGVFHTIFPEEVDAIPLRLRCHFEEAAKVRKLLNFRCQDGSFGRHLVGH